jgi:hypothetical protein
VEGYTCAYDNLFVKKNKYIMYKVQDYISVFFTVTLLTQFYVSVESCMTASFYNDNIFDPIKLL